MMRLIALLAVASLWGCGAAQETAPGSGEAHDGAMHEVGEMRTPAQRAFAEANARMHAAMSEIPPDADEAFVRGMLAHHRGAVEMAEVELAHGTDPPARELARTIIAAQTDEIAQMEAWLARDAGKRAGRDDDDAR